MPFTPDDVLDYWDDDGWFNGEERVTRYPVWLGDVPTSLLLSAKAHVDNLVREFTLAARGAESNVSGQLPPHLASLIETVVNRFSEARQAIKRQALIGGQPGPPARPSGAEPAGQRRRRRRGVPAGAG